MENNNQKPVKNENNNKDNKLLYKILLVVFLLIFIVSASMFGVNKYRQAKAEREYAALLETMAQEEAVAEAPVEAEDVTEEVTEEPEVVEEATAPDHNLDWDAIHAQNPDIYAWIYIPNTQIDYPILSSGTDKGVDFYLDHNLDGSYGPYPGCIYSQSTYNNTKFTDFNLVLYGHNMKNGGMFNNLHKWEDLTFFNENQYIYVYTPDKNYVYQVFAAYKTDDQLLFEKYNYSSEFGIMQYLDEILAKRDASSHISDAVVPQYYNKIITLSTCVSGQASNRWVVQGVML